MHNLIFVRIRTILCLWLSHHWGDIYYGQSHQTLHLFLRRLGHNQQLSTMYQLLGPLITRPGPANDPDSVWGLTDEESPSSNHKNSIYEAWANSPSIATMLCMSPSNQSMTSDGSSTVRNQHQRRSSSFDWYKEVDPLASPHVPSTSTITPSSTSSTAHRGRSTPLATPYSTVSMDCKLDRRKKKKDDSTRTSFFKNGISTKLNRRSTHQQFMGHLASFGGGLVLLETTGRRPFSLIALQSSLRHMSHVRYAMLMDLSVDLLAEQLTWVELTLYRNIKVLPRQQIRTGHSYFFFSFSSSLEITSVICGVKRGLQKRWWPFYRMVSLSRAGSSRWCWCKTIPANKSPFTANLSTWPTACTKTIETTIRWRQSWMDYMAYNLSDVAWMTPNSNNYKNWKR